MRTIESECMPWRTLARVQLSPSSALIMTPCPTVPTRMFPLLVISHLLTRIRRVSSPDYTPLATARRAAAISAGAASGPGKSRSARLYQPRALSRSPSRMCTIPCSHAASVDFSFWTISCACFQSPAASNSTAQVRESLMSVLLEGWRGDLAKNILTPRGRREKRRFREGAAHELDAERETRRREAAGHRDRRQ